MLGLSSFAYLIEGSQRGKIFLINIITDLSERKMNIIYVGYDPKESLYTDILIKSIKVNTKDRYIIVPIIQKNMRDFGYYNRTSFFENDIELDTIDQKPFSTQFSFTRFLVPFLTNGLVLFMDCDMFVRSDITEIFDMYDKHIPIKCVKHNHEPIETLKMDNIIQTKYRKKNWSSFVLWNCDHPDIKKLTLDDVNTKHGSWLHGFEWTDNIGDIPHEWNWLDNHSPENLNAKNVHFTTGGPIYPNWIGNRDIDRKYAQEWIDFKNSF